METLSSYTLIAYLRRIYRDENFWNAFLVFSGAFSILLAFPFYPIFFVFLLALVCGAFAYKKPFAGTLSSVILAFPAIAYQTPLMAWLFTLIISITLFEVFEQWAVISALEILIFLPFAPYPLSYLGGFVILGMVISALHFGSKKSLLISIPSIFLILLLSTLWHHNISYFPLYANYHSSNILSNTKPVVGVFELPNKLITSISSLFSPQYALSINSAIGVVVYNTTRILFADFGLFYLILWAIILYLISFISGRIKTHTQSLPSLILFLAPISYYFILSSFHKPFNFDILIYSIISYIFILFFEHEKIYFSRESQIVRQEKLKKFGKLGLIDLSLSSKEKGLEDVGDYEEVKKELLNSIVTPIERITLAERYNLKPPKGILFFGPPGTGKTMLMRALAREIKYSFYYVKASELLSPWTGESERNITELFDIARKNAPCILFFDEIDALGKKRSMSDNSKVLSTLLEEMDGANAYKKPIIVIGATNVPNQLDPALLRPGRFDKIIYMPLPDEHAREEIFKVHIKKYPHDNIDYKILAKKTKRFSGADIANVVKEAVRRVAKRAEEVNKVIPLTTKDLLKVIKETKPSVKLADIEMYEQFKIDFERNFNKTKIKKHREIRWEDVVGLDKVKQSLLDAITLPLFHEDLIKRYNLRPSKGILLFGPPGCGKTMIIKAAANELKATFIYVSASDLERGGAEKIKEIFLRARENKPSLIFIDEIETLAPSRKFQISDLLGELLTQMDGIKDLNGVVVVGATNKPSYLDEALLRPGRFDKIFYIGPPNFEARREILMKNLTFDTDFLIDFDLLAKETEGFSGADLVAVAEEVKLKLVKDIIAGKKPELATDDILKVIKSRKPSITKELLKEYEEFLRAYGERT